METITQLRQTKKYKSFFNNLSIDKCKNITTVELNEAVKYYAFISFFDSSNIKDYIKKKNIARNGLIEILAYNDFLIKNK